jgi:hypothetical protein
MSYNETRDLYGAYCIYRESGKPEKYREHISSGNRSAIRERWETCGMSADIILTRSQNVFHADAHRLSAKAPPC